MKSEEFFQYNDVYGVSTQERVIQLKDDLEYIPLSSIISKALPSWEGRNTNNCNNLFFDRYIGKLSSIKSDRIASIIINKNIESIFDNWQRVTLEHLLRPPYYMQFIDFTHISYVSNKRSKRGCITQHILSGYYGIPSGLIAYNMILGRHNNIIATLAVKRENLNILVQRGFNQIDISEYIVLMIKSSIAYHGIKYSNLSTSYDPTNKFISNIFNIYLKA